MHTVIKTQREVPCPATLSLLNNTSRVHKLPEPILQRPLRGTGVKGGHDVAQRNPFGMAANNLLDRSEIALGYGLGHGVLLLRASIYTQLTHAYKQNSSLYATIDRKSTRLNSSH